MVFSIAHRTVAGFDWDTGNRAKCQQHGVSLGEIEGLFARTMAVQSDPAAIETRFRAIGRMDEGRHVFLVFTFRTRGDDTLVRPISARYMHQKEIELYEEKNPDLRDR